MSIWLGPDEADAIYLGTDPVDAVYLGEDLVWPVGGGIEFIGSNWNGGTTVTLPGGVQAGDLCVFYAGNTNAFGTQPTLPAGLTNLRNGGTFGAAGRVAYKYATSSGETSGTWTNATMLHCNVYRNAQVGVNAWGGVSNQWPALSGFSTDAWLYRAALGATATLTMPAGFTDRGGATSGTRCRTGDTNAPRGSTSVAAATISPAANTYVITLALEPA